MVNTFTWRALAAMAAPLVVGSVLFAAPANAYDTTDTDGDGSADIFEKIYGTDPNSANSYLIDGDADGYPDVWEQENGSDPLDELSYPLTEPVAPAPAADDPADEPAAGTSLDSDGDGLFDADETDVYGTNPKDPDTDGDGGDDGFEVYSSTNPLVADDQTQEDSDGDGLFDTDEQQLYGTNPALFDSDFDGVGDGAENENGTDPTDSTDS